MKILHIAPVGFNRASGPSNSVFGLAKGQAMLGHSVALLSSIPTEIPSKNIVSGVILLASPIVRHINPWRLSKEWISIIKEDFGKPDIVNFHDTYIPFQTALAELFIIENWPYVFTPRGGLTLLAQGVKAYKKIPANFLFFDKFVKNAILIHALCEKEAADIQIRYPKSKIFVVSNGVDEDLLSTCDEIQKNETSAFQKEGELVIGFIGRIDVYHKGIDLLLMAISSLQNNDFGRNIKLVIIGPYHSKKDRIIIEKILEEMPLKKNIIIKGPVFGLEKWQEMNNFDIFTHTSRFEGVPNSVLEAMALGKPCLVTSGTNMAGIVNKNKCGWGCETSVESICETIGLINDRKNYEVMQYGFNARKYIIKNHLMKDISEKCVDVYKSIF